MPIPWLRSNFLARRMLDRLILDMPDAALRFATGRRHWPPYSLRSFVGGSRDFEDVGRWFLQDLRSLNLLSPGTRVLEIGCGCGRLAYPLATEETLAAQELSYDGMDIDRASIEWCRRNITPLHPTFRFYQADCFNASYNPQGAIALRDYRFPHNDESFDLIVLTSVLTHLVADELAHYLAEVERLLAPDGTAYASLFLYGDPEEAAAEKSRHGIAFPVARGGYAVNRADFPANAVAYQESFLVNFVRQAGLQLLGPARYGAQDLVLLTKQGSARVHLDRGWHDLEGDSWRWTQRTFSVFAERPQGSAAAQLQFRFTAPAPLFEETGAVRLRASVNGVRLPARDYRISGEHLYQEDIPAEVLSGDPLYIEFEVENPYGPSASDPRELGVQVVFASPCNRTIRIWHPIRVI